MHKMKTTSIVFFGHKIEATALLAMFFLLREKAKNKTSYHFLFDIKIGLKKKILTILSSGFNGATLGVVLRAQLPQLQG